MIRSLECAVWRMELSIRWELRGCRGRWPLDDWRCWRHDHGMDRRVGFVAVVGVMIAAFVGVARRYRRDLAAAYERLDAVDRAEFSSTRGGLG